MTSCATTAKPRPVSPARADGYPNLRAITPLKGPIAGKGGVSWIEITSTVNNPGLSPLAVEFLKYVQEPEVAHKVAFADVEQGGGDLASEGEGVKCLAAHQSDPCVLDVHFELVGIATRRTCGWGARGHR